MELDAESDIKAAEGEGDVDEDLAEEMENAPTHNAGHR